MPLSERAALDLVPAVTPAPVHFDLQLLFACPEGAGGFSPREKVPFTMAFRPGSALFRSCMENQE
jgi:hypothetical protein